MGVVTQANLLKDLRETLFFNKHILPALCVSLSLDISTSMSHLKYRKETNCLNCGAEVTDKYCPNCGQPNLEINENVFHMAVHFLADYFHYDSKFVRSLLPLFTKPGFLTKEYWEGKRTSYIHPLRLYFFVTIIFMIATTYFYHHFDKEVRRSIIYKSVVVTKDSIPAQASDSLKHIAQKSKEEQQRKEEDKAVDKLGEGMNNFFRDLKYISFFLLPFYALIFKLLYIRRKHFYVQHLVYTLHLQSFVYILVSIAVLIPFVFPESMHWLRRSVLVIVMIYIAISFRYLYHQVWWKTVVKAILATILLALTTGIALGVYMTVSLLGS